MGSYHSWKLDANTSNNNTLGRIRAFLEEFPNPYDSDAVEDCTDFWLQWNEESRWYWAEDVAVALSKAFPQVMFCLERNGDDGYGKWFYLGGDELPAEFVDLPKFPSVNQFKHGKTKQKAAAKTLKVRAQKAEAASKKAELSKIQAKAKRLKSELKSLEV